MQPDQLKKLFEQACKIRQICTDKLPNGDYISSYTEGAWQGFQLGFRAKTVQAFKPTAMGVNNGT